MLARLRKSLMAFSFLSLSLPYFASAGLIGTTGMTYPFAERDALTEIEESAGKVNWQTLYSRERNRAENYRPSSLPTLPRAASNTVRSIDMTYTLDEDIPDPRQPGKVLYPKGFAFNPLEYLALPGAIVFLDASDKGQLEWLRSSPWWNDDAATIVLIGGDAKKIAKLAGRPTYFGDRKLVERLDIQAVPSVARQKGNTMIVEEIRVQDRHR